MVLVRNTYFHSREPIYNIHIPLFILYIYEAVHYQQTLDLASGRVLHNKVLPSLVPVNLLAQDVKRGTILIFQERKDRLESGA